MNYDEEKFERPSWTLFFEGTLYRRYLEYLKHHDLSQMLNNGTTVTSSYANAVQPPILTHETSWCPQEKFPPPEDDMPPPYHSRIASTSSERSNLKFDYKAIQRRTRMLVCVGITLIALTAAVVALTIHYVYIEATESVIESGRIHIPGNFTANETLAILQDKNTSIFMIKNYTNDVFGEIEVKSVSKDPGSGSFWRNDPSTSTTTKKPRLVIITQTTVEEPLEWESTTSESPATFEPIFISDVETSIGEKEASVICRVQTTDWDFVYLKSSSVMLNFTKSKTIKTNGHHSKYSFDYDFKIMDGSDMTEIKLSIMVRNVECDDQQKFTCGFFSNSMVIEKQAKLTVQRKPTSYIKTKQPVGIIEGQTVELEATWKAGYPVPVGNITWFYTNSNNSTEWQSFNGDISWRMKTNTDTCKTYINSIVKFIPTMEMNGTILHAASTFEQVTPGEEEILVVPASYCDEVSGDVYKPHPYTCKKFVRCRSERMDVYECPKTMCFSAELSQCDIITQE